MAAHRGADLTSNSAGAAAAKQVSNELYQNSQNSRSGRQGPAAATGA